MIVDTIHCFYQELGWQHHRELLPFWEERWRREGWKTKILGLKDARKDYRYNAMLRKSLHLPTVNNRQYEQANYIRWLAFSQVNGALADYDVFPIRPFPPFECNGFTACSLSGGPDFICGSSSDFSGFADEILYHPPSKCMTINGRQHVSDMYILIWNLGRYQEVKDLCTVFHTNRWMDRPIIHFGSESMENLKVNGSKLQKIKTALAVLYP